MSTQANSPHLPLHILNRGGVAAKDVVAQNSDNEAIAAVGAALVPVADRFAERYQGLRAAVAQQHTLIIERDQVVAALGRAFATWGGPLGRDLESFDASQFGRRPNVPVDMVDDGWALIRLVQDSVGQLPYGERLIALLTERVEAAAAATSKAHEARTTLQLEQAATRELGAELQQHLIALRQVVRSELGPQSHHYQRLRVERVRAEAEAEADVEGDVAP